MSKGMFFFTVVFCFCVSSLAGATGKEANVDDIISLNIAQEKIFRDHPRPVPKIDMALIDKVYEKGNLPVIVRLREIDQPYGVFSDRSAPRDQIINSLQDTVLNEVFAHTGRYEDDLQVKRFSIIPGMALQVEPAELDALLDNPNVIDIIEDVAVPPALYESVPLIGGGADGSFSGYTGQGQTVAVLDTGVDKNHLFLSGKVVSEACYSSNVPNYNATSLCPGGVTESTASGSGLHCTGMSACDHGTHVAGIVAGKRSQLQGGTYISGVAKDANIIAIQVFSRIDSVATCSPSPSPCATTYWSDLQLGLERVYALRNNYNIAAVNMSLGAGKYTSPCDGFTLKPIIDILRTSDIATVISSGNNGFTDALGAPACISTAVSVGNTTLDDEVSGGSNSSYFLSLLAPGTDILSSVPSGSSLGVKTGTSMAAPHVAGAWAVIKEANPDASVTEVLNALKAKGKNIIDWRAGAGARTKPRIDVKNALKGLATCIVEWDLNGDCYVNKDDAKILKIQQKIEKIELKFKHNEEKQWMKDSMGYYITPCGAGPDLNGDCYVDKDDAKILKILQKIEKNFLKENHTAEKTGMKAALKAAR